MTDSLSPEKRSWNMSCIRSKDTRPEKAVRSVRIIIFFGSYDDHQWKLSLKNILIVIQQKLNIWRKSAWQWYWFSIVTED